MKAREILGAGVLLAVISGIAAAQTMPSTAQYPGTNPVRGVTADRCYVSPDVGVTWAPMLQPVPMDPTGINDAQQNRRLLEQILQADKVIILELEALRAPGPSAPIPGINDVFPTGVSQ